MGDEDASSFLLSKAQGVFDSARSLSLSSVASFAVLVVYVFVVVDDGDRDAQAASWRGRV